MGSNTGGRRSGDWVLPFVYNVGLTGMRSAILPWIFFGGLLVLYRKYQSAPDRASPLMPETP
ncbi:MAG: hypothetical protein R3E79_32540 [Caldilineaceae bacterium]